VLTAPGLELVEQQSFPIILSDHRPIVGVVRLPGVVDEEALADTGRDLSGLDVEPSALAAGH
jgi:hypothetical protein